MKTKNMPALADKPLVKESNLVLQQMLENCPDPTQEELRKILAVQGAVLNAAGLEILMENLGKKRNTAKISLAIKLMKASQESLSSASRIRVANPDGLIPLGGEVSEPGEDEDIKKPPTSEEADGS